ncbi:MAG: MerR family transcriptional regulator [Clostridia bacterium]|jgi:flagellar operon protein (TIGR03826 family)|nr:MerR family transcriptional regulator [Clostridia bacterium]
MNLKNCKMCGKMYEYNGKPICPDCERQDEEDFEKVKDYLDDNPSTTVQEISDETEVSIRRITRYLKEGRLEFIQGGSPLLTCEKCGAAISTGRFCQNCMKALGKGFGIDTDGNRIGDPRPEGPKMHRGKSDRI